MNAITAITSGQMLRGLRLLLLTIGSGLLVSCGSGDDMMHDPSTILQKIRASYDGTPDLTIEGSMKASGTPATVTFTAYVQEYEALKMPLNGPFGIAVGGLAASPLEFIFVSALEGVAYRGKPDRSTFGRAVRISLDYRELLALIRSEVPTIPTRDELARGEVTASQEDGVLTYRLQNNDTVERFVIDPEKLVVREYSQSLERSGKDPQMLLEVRYRDFFTKVNDRYFPEEAHMSVDGGEMTVKVTIDRVTSGIPEGTKMTIDLPAGMDIREL